MIPDGVQIGFLWIIVGLMQFQSWQDRKDIRKLEEKLAEKFPEMADAMDCL